MKGSFKNVIKKPKVSIVMPVYNGEKYLREAIKSTLGQTFKDFEFIIVNDGSIDGTANILKSFKDKRIKIIVNSKNLGLIEALNIGVRNTKGEYIARFDADDVYDKDRLTKQVSFLERKKDYVLVGSCGTWINEQGKELGLLDVPLADSEIRQKILLKNPIIHASVIFRSSEINRDSCYRKVFSGGGEDYDLWFRLLKRGKFQNLADKFIKRRWHKEAFSQKFHIRVELLAIGVRLVNLPFFKVENLDILVGIFSFLIYRFFFVYLLFQNRTVPPEPDDSYFYLSAAKHFPAIFNYEEFRLFLYSGWLKLLSIFTSNNLESAYKLNFYIGVCLLFISLVYFCRLIEKNKIFRVILISIVGIYSGSGAYHGFYWVVQSFYQLLVFIVIVALLFKDRVRYLVLFLLTILFIFIHPSSIFMLLVFPFWGILLFSYNRSFTPFFKKTVMVFITGLLTYFGYYLLSKFWLQNEDFTSPTEVLLRLAGMFRGNIELVSGPIIWREYFNFLFISPMVIGGFIACLYFTYKLNLKIFFLFCSLLLLVVLAMFIPFGYRALNFLWFVTFIIFGYGLCGVYSTIKLLNLKLASIVTLVGYLSFLFIMTIFNLIWIKSINVKNNYNWDKSCAEFKTTEMHIYFVGWDSYFAFQTYGFSLKKAKIVTENTKLNKGELVVMPVQKLNNMPIMSDIERYLANNITRKNDYPIYEYSNYYWYRVANINQEKELEEIKRCGYFSVFKIR